MFSYATTELWPCRSVPVVKSYCIESNAGQAMVCGKYPMTGTGIYILYIYIYLYVYIYIYVCVCVQVSGYLHSPPQKVLELNMGKCRVNFGCLEIGNTKMIQDA